MNSSPDARAANEAHRRAHSVARLLSSGMEYADVMALHASVDDGRDWRQAAAELGDRNAARAEHAVNNGETSTAGSWHLYAASCYRTAQAVLPDDHPDKRPLYAKAIDQFQRAGALQDPPFEHLRVRYGTREVRAWLIRPRAVPRPPTVLVVGGFDGWREEHELASRALVDRGIAVVLVEAPGQGETRLFAGNYMYSGFEEAFSAILDTVLADARLSDTVGVWGNSFGGLLATRAALADDRFTALCVNGGSVRPAEVLERFPRLITKVQDLFGIDDPDKAQRALEDFSLEPEQLARLSASLLVLHGTPDQIFLIENARRLHDWAGGSDKSFLEWSDGEHCIYNHAHERNVSIADWFAQRLRR